VSCVASVAIDVSVSLAASVTSVAIDVSVCLAASVASVAIDVSASLAASGTSVAVFLTFFHPHMEFVLHLAYTNYGKF
jgi:hypothetical protein